MFSLREVRKYTVLGILALLSLIGLFIVTRINTNPKWVCENGEWVMKGEVKEPKPFTVCK